MILKQGAIARIVCASRNPANVSNIASQDCSEWEPSLFSHRHDTSEAVCARLHMQLLWKCNGTAFRPAGETQCCLRHIMWGDTVTHNASARQVRIRPRFSGPQ